ncbi:MAG TPA: hypothetical protein VH137_04610 [Gemmatimonadales bacterium]|jgi:Tfp pilus assembly protein PilO|nr:hypothetical protein [Gemmatimonadales bacterium]
MFFGIPEWAIGVGFIVLAASLAGSIGRALQGRFAPPSDQLPRRNASRRELARSFEDVSRRLAELEEQPQRAGDLEDMQRRLAEIEERLDFAERLLAKQRDVERVAPPKG